MVGGRQLRIDPPEAPAGRFGKREVDQDEPALEADHRRAAEAAPRDDCLA